VWDNYTIGRGEIEGVEVNEVEAKGRMFITNKGDGKKAIKKRYANSAV